MDAQELQRLKELAQKADKDIIRSHGWKGTVMEFDALHADEQFLLAANPVTVLELIEIAERAASPAESVQSIISDAHFRILMRQHREADSGAHVVYKDLADYIDAKIATAHAEGRRSVLEELQQRAEMAEAEVATWKHYAEAQPTAEELAKEKERADRAEAELAARQAPDLGHLPCYKLSDGLLIPVGIVKTIIDRGDMMLSLLDVRTALLAQPLQQEGWKDAPADSLLRELTKASVGSCNCGAKTPDHRLHNYGCRYRAIETAAIALSQPSGNLQQASTAQAEPAKFPPLEFSHDVLGNKAAASATDADRAAIAAIKKRTDAMAAEMLDRIHSAFPAAQATPEGADLPPLTIAAYLWEKDGMTYLTSGDFFGTDRRIYSVADSYRVGDDELQPLVKISDVRDAVFGAKSAEPVCQVRDLEQSGFWSDVSIDNMLRCMDRGYKTRVLYRAAPPQQVGPEEHEDHCCLRFIACRGPCDCKLSKKGNPNDKT